MLTCINNLKYKYLRFVKCFNKPVVFKKITKNSKRLSVNDNRLILDSCVLNYRRPSTLEIETIAKKIDQPVDKVTKKINQILKDRL